MEEDEKTAKEEVMEAAEADDQENQFYSPLLNKLDPKRLPKQETVCMFCHNALWMANQETLECYCRITMQSAWSTEKPTALTACDGMFVN